jgi:hypothetical protein
MRGHFGLTKIPIRQAPERLLAVKVATDPSPAWAADPQLASIYSVNLAAVMD